jgi:hypothetical protein
MTKDISSWQSVSAWCNTSNKCYNPKTYLQDRESAPSTVFCWTPIFVLTNYKRYTCTGTNTAQHGNYLDQTQIRTVCWKSSEPKALLPSQTLDIATATASIINTLNATRKQYLRSIIMPSALITSKRNTDTGGHVCFLWIIDRRYELLRIYSVDDIWMNINIENWCNYNWRTQSETRPSATLSTINPAWTKNIMIAWSLTFES